MVFIDQIGRKIDIENIPQKIISVVPSQTELLFYLVNKERIIGKTRFCIHPKMDIEQAENVGGTKKLHLEKIAKLKPEIIFANKEENTREDLEWLFERFPVWVSDIYKLQDALNMITQVGRIVGEENNAVQLADTIKVSFENLAQNNFGKALYMIWRNPWMTVGSNTFIHEMMKYAGFRNAWEGEDARYPEISEEKIKELHPDWILLSSEPYPFKQKHINELHQLIPKSKIVLVDGEMFSWYGVKLLASAKYFKQKFAMPV